MSAGQEWTPSVRRVDEQRQDKPNSEPDRSDRLQQAAALLREERFEEAQDQLHAILRDDEKSIKARVLLGAVHLRQRQYVDALDQFKQAIQLDALMIQAHLLAGTCYLRLGDVEQAKIEYQTTLDLDPNQVNAHFGMAQILVQEGQAAQGMPHLEEALRLDPQMNSARMLMARLLNESGNVDAAIDQLTSLVHLDPENIGASLKLAMMQLQKGNNDAAVELLAAVSEANPDSAQMWNAIGRMKLTVNDYEGAEKAFIQAIELKTPDRATPLRLIDALIKQGKLDEARERLQNVPRREPMKSVVYRLYGDIYAAKGLHDEAVDSYRASVLHTPNGEKILAEIEAAAGPGASSETKIPHFATTFAKLREERRQAQGGPLARRMR